MKEFKESILQTREEETLLEDVILENIEILKKLPNENLKRKF